jgi:hypothetical protein
MLRSDLPFSCVLPLPTYFVQQRASMAQGRSVRNQLGPKHLTLTVHFQAQPSLTRLAYSAAYGYVLYA